MKIEFYTESTKEAVFDQDGYFVDKDGRVLFQYYDGSEHVIKAAVGIGWRIIDQWQPIETAPKDGTVIFAIIKDYHCPIAIQFIENEWMSCWDEKIFNNVNIFSHWMSLLPNPQS